MTKEKLTPREMKEVQAAAWMILRSPDLLNQFLDAVKRQGLVGEEKAALVILIVVVSRLLKQPLNFLVKGKSSSGKNYAIRKVLSLLPRSASLKSPVALQGRGTMPRMSSVTV